MSCSTIYVLRNFLSFLNFACITKEVMKTNMESVFTLLESATSEYYVWLCAGPKNSKVLEVKVYTQLCFCYFSCQGLFWKYNQLPKNETSSMWLLSKVLGFEYSKYGRTSRHHGSIYFIKEVDLSCSFFQVIIVNCPNTPLQYNSQNKQCGHTLRIDEAWPSFRHMYHTPAVCSTHVTCLVVTFLICCLLSVQLLGMYLSSHFTGTEAKNYRVKLPGICLLSKIHLNILKSMFFALVSNSFFNIFLFIRKGIWEKSKDSVSFLSQHPYFPPGTISKFFWCFPRGKRDGNRKTHQLY